VRSEARNPQTLIARKLTAHVRRLLACQRCPRMLKPVVSGGPVVSQVVLIGQAPGAKEPGAGRPFAWTAGRTLFRWFEEACGMTEAQFRTSIYLAAVCRCFPGKKPTGGDRVPDDDEIANCSHWLAHEMRLLKPALVIPVGKLAIAQVLPGDRRLEDLVGRRWRAAYAGHAFDVIPLPHPSGASPWHRIEPGRTLLLRAMQAIVRHQAFASRLNATHR
jgi:uracil-DNA glycosylase